MSYICSEINLFQIKTIRQTNTRTQLYTHIEIVSFPTKVNTSSAILVKILNFLIA